MLISVTRTIEKILDFVTSTVHPNNAGHLDLSETGTKTLIDTLFINTESIRRNLVVSVFSSERQCEVESLVQNYQSLIIKLLNVFYTFQSDQTTSSDLHNLYTSLSDILADVLTYIETYFSKYFNLDVEIPHLQYSSNIEFFQKKFNEFINAFKDNLEDLELIAMLNSHYASFANTVNIKTITFQDLIYIKELIRELNDIVLKSSIYKSVKEVLLYANYNHIEFFKYLVDKLQGEYNNLETLDAKLEFLKYQRKLFRQKHINSNLALFSQFTSIKEQVLNWIEEEIIFMESQIKAVDQGLEKKDIERVSEPKIIVALSVAQLAFLIRVLTLGKVIRNNNQSDVVRIFASNFKTYKTEDISYGSLYGKYFKPEISAIRQVKGILLELANLITKMKE